MQDSKLIDLMRKLSSAQVRQFDRWLPALVVVQNNEIQRLFQHLIGFAPQYKSSKLERKKVQQTLGWNAKKLTDRSSLLLQLLGQCLIIEQVLNDPLEQQLRLMDIFEQLDLDKHFQTAKRQAHKTLDGTQRRGTTLLQQQHRLRELEARAQETYQRQHKPSLQLATDALDEFYLANKLSYLLEMTSAGSVLDIPYEIRLAEAVKHWAQQAPFSDSPLIKLYHATIQLVEEPEQQNHFLQLRELLQQHEPSIPLLQLKQLYTYLLNYCTRRITKVGDATYYQHYLDINTRLIDQGLLLEDGLLLPWRYSNLITVGLRTGKMQWTHNFLENYRTYLPPEDSENTYNFNLAHYLYYKQAFDEALLLLLQIDLRDPLLAIAAKNLMAKIYWETDQTELLLTFLENYRLYIYRQQLAKKHLKQQVKNFIDVTRRMAKIPDFEPEKYQELLDTLPLASDMLEHEWLRKQLQDRCTSKH